MTDTTDRYRKRPVEIEARQLLASEDGEAARELAAWCSGWIGGSFAEPRIVISTLEGEMVARPGDWIIRGVAGEFYPCRDDIFAATYEPAAAPVVPPADRAAEAALVDRLIEHCPEHGCVEPEWEDGCHCEIVPLLRRVADEAQPTTKSEPLCRCGHGNGAHNVSGCTECPGGWRADHRFAPAVVSEPGKEA